MLVEKKMSLWTRIRFIKKIGKRLKQMPNVNFTWSWYGSDNLRDDLLNEIGESTEADVSEIAAIALPERNPGDWYVKFTVLDVLKHWRATGVSMYVDGRVDGRIDCWSPTRYTYTYPAAWQWKKMTCVQHGFYHIVKFLSVLVNCMFPKAIFWSICNEILDCILKDTTTPYYFDRGDGRKTAFEAVEKLFFRADSVEELELKLAVMNI